MEDTKLDLIVMNGMYRQVSSSFLVKNTVVNCFRRVGDKAIAATTRSAVGS